MGKFKHVIIAVIAVMAAVLPASAQFRFGITAGLNVNSVSFSNLGSNFDKENRTGFTGGIITEFTVPVIGLGFDLSLLYSHRNIGGNVVSNGNTTGDNVEDVISDPNFRKQDYLEIPLNLKYKFSLPVVGYFLKPYLTTGPSFAFKCSKAAVTEAYKEKKFDATWNLGGGVQLLNHLQIGVNYGWGMTKALEFVGVGNEQADLGKINGWKITASYLF